MIGEFYVSDSYTIQSVTPPTTVHYPGVFNSGFIWGPGQNVVVDVLAGEFGFIPLSADDLSGFNVDVQIGMYEVSGPATPYGPPVPFGAPFGTAPNGLVMNATTRRGHYGRAVRRFARRLRLHGGTGTDKPMTQIGAIITFRCSVASLVQYQYFLQGIMSDSVAELDNYWAARGL